MYVLFLLWTYVCTYTSLFFYSPTCICTLIKVNLRIPLSWPAALWSIIWVSCHQGQHLYHTSEWVAIKDNTCIIMPTISPFGLDGNHHTKSLSPLTSRAKCGPWYSLLWYTFCYPYPPLVHAKVSDIAPPLYMPRCTNSYMLPLSTCKVCKSITWLYTYINPPLKWEYTIFDSSTQPSGDIPNVYTWLNNKKHYIIHPMHSGVTKYIIWLTKTKDLNKTMIVISSYHTPYDLHHKNLSLASKPITCNPFSWSSKMY